MTAQAIKEQVTALKNHTKKATSSKENAKKFLISTGVYTKKGNLTKHFK
jgi:hypothetical protein